MRDNRVNKERNRQVRLRLALMSILTRGRQGKFRVMEKLGVEEGLRGDDDIWTEKTQRTEWYQSSQSLSVCVGGSVQKIQLEQ